MKFLSIKEYFYKLTTLGFILLLLPMLVFAFLYYRSLLVSPLILDEKRAMEVLYGFLILSVLVLTIVHWVWIVRIKRYRSLIELAKRMDRYFSLTFMKFGFYCACSLLMAAGFFLIEDKIFIAGFIVLSLAMILQWPSRSHFCRQLNLNKNEREMILTSGDLYKRNKGV